MHNCISVNLRQAIPTRYSQSQSIVPTPWEITNIDFIIARCLPLTPQQKPLLCTQPLSVDIADGEPENQRPYQTQDNFAVAVHNILSPNVGELYTPALDVVERYINIFKSLYPQLRFSGVATNGVVAKDFEKVDEDDLVSLC